MQKIIKCKECKWWGREWKGSLPGGHDHGNCDHPKVGRELYPYESRQPIDGLSFWELISTGPDFGCIHGEKK